MLPRLWTGILLLSGDIQLNPGPVKFPCGICRLAVATNHRALECESCETWFHIKCVSVSPSDYTRYQEQPNLTWACTTCILPDVGSSFFGNPDHTSLSVSSCSSCPGLKSVSRGLLSCQSFNARGIYSKSKDLQGLLEADQMDVIAITETFLDEKILDSEILSGPFSMFRRDRDRHGGGVMLIIRNNIPAVRREVS